MNAKTFPLLVLLIAVSAIPSCVRAELARAKKARADYLECREEHPREPERCEELRAAMNREYDRYEAVAGERARNWRDEEEFPN